MKIKIPILSRGSNYRVSWERLGENVYKALGDALTDAADTDNGEICALYAPVVAWLLVQERANYFGTIWPGWNYVSLFTTLERALVIAEREGYPEWLGDGVKEAEKVLRKLR